MAEGIDYRRSKPIWQALKPDKDGKARWQVTIRVKVPSGIDDGKTIYKTKRISKVFRGAFDTEAKRRNATGKWIASMERADKAAEAAKVEAIEAERAAREEAERAAKMVTVSEYVSEFIDMLDSTKTVRKSTVYAYRQSAKHVDRGFPDIPIQDLTAAQIQQWEVDGMKRGYASSTVTKWHRLLSEACKQAVNTDVIQRNPCDRVRAPKMKSPSPNSLTTEQFARLAATLDALEPTQTVTGADIALFTGMREGEVCGLRWRAYDPDARTITVSESIGIAAGKTYSSRPKTERSRRTIPVPDPLAAMLERRRQHMVERLQALGIDLSDEEFGELYVIGHTDGRYKNPHGLGAEWRALAKSYGLRGTQGRPITFHDLRHSFISVSVAAGADIRSIADIAGHSSTKLVLDTYADSSPEGKRQASNRMISEVASVPNALPFPTEATTGAEVGAIIEKVTEAVGTLAE